MIILLLIVAVGIALLFINQMDSVNNSIDSTTKTTDVADSLTQQAKDAVDALNGKTTMTAE